MAQGDTHIIRDHDKGIETVHRECFSGFSGTASFNGIELGKFTDAKILKLVSERKLEPADDSPSHGQ